MSTGIQISGPAIPKQPYFLVTSYGAKGDGTSDDTQAIKDTISACVAAGGGRVVFPVGTYKVFSTITLYSNITLSGLKAGLLAGESVITKGSVIKWAGSTSDDIFYSSGAQHLTIDGIVINGDHIASCRAIVIDSDNNPISRHVCMRDITIINMGTVLGNDGVGIQVGTVTGGGTQYQSDGVVIERFFICDVGTGIKIASQNSMNYSSIRNGAIGYCQRGIDIVQSAGPNIECVAGLGYRGTNPALIYATGPAYGPLWINNVTSEPADATQGETFRFTGGDYLYPVTIVCSNPDDSTFAATMKVISIGNCWRGDVTLSGNTLMLFSMGDSFTGSHSFLKTGSNVCVISGLEGVGNKLSITGGSNVQLLVGDGTNSFSIGRSTSTGHLTVTGTQTGYVGVNLDVEKVYTAGDVGVNTSTPRAPLEVRAATDLSLLFDSVTGKSRITTTNDAGSTNVPLAIQADGIHFYNNTAASEVVTITGGGLVGIANTSPATRLDIADGALQMMEMSAPSAGTSGSARVFCRDSGTSGKSQLCVQFGSGALQVLATEP